VWIRFENIRYIIINTQLVTCFGSSEQSAGQLLIYRHGAFSLYIKNWPEDCSLEPKHADNYIYRVSQEERTKLRQGVPYVKLYRYNPKHLCPKLNGY